MTKAGPAAIYPGTFDPVTLGHMDVVRRARGLFGSVRVAVLENTAKAPLFDAEERRAMFAEALRSEGIEGVDVVAFDGLLVEFARRIGARTIVRGLRAMSDFEYELQMAQMNRRLDESIETVFLTPDEAVASISSRLVREIAQLGGDVSELVPEAALDRLRARLGRHERGGV
jgi:pantetheine-phosphate adenylyltransferase